SRPLRISACRQNRELTRPPPSLTLTMTVAVCLKCGAMKHGAWTSCPKCNYLPNDPDDKARHVITSDHHFSQADLEKISAGIQSGQPPQFNQKQVNEIASSITKLNPEKGVRLFLYGFFAIVIAVILGTIYLVAKFVMK